MTSKDKEAPKSRVSENKYKNEGIVPPVIQQLVAGHVQTAAPKRKLSKFQRKFVQRESE